MWLTGCQCHAHERVSVLCAGRRGKQLAELGRAVGAAKESDPDAEAGGRFLAAVQEMITGLEIPTLQEYGIDREAFYSQIEKMAQDAMDSGSPQNTMRQPNRQAVMDIYKKIYEGE